MNCSAKLRKLISDNLDRPRSFRSEQVGSEATVYLYDAIGWLGVEASDFVKEIGRIDADVIHLRINSPGGDVFDAKAMKTALSQHRAKVIAHIDGLSASAATTVMLAADEIRAAAGSFIMIHHAWSLAIGDARDMREMADLLDKIDAAIADEYQARTGLEQAEIVEMLDAETWMEAKEALDLGFVDQVVETTKANNQFDLSAYDRAPDALRNAAETPSQPDPMAVIALRERRLRLSSAEAA